MAAPRMGWLANFSLFILGIVNTMGWVNAPNSLLSVFSFLNNRDNQALCGEGHLRYLTCNSIPASVNATQTQKNEF